MILFVDGTFDIPTVPISSKIPNTQKAPDTAIPNVAPKGNLEVLLSELSNGSYRVVHSKEQKLFIALLKYV